MTIAYEKRKGLRTLGSLLLVLAVEELLRVTIILLLPCVLDIFEYREFESSRLRIEERCV